MKTDFLVADDSLPPPEDHVTSPPWYEDRHVLYACPPDLYQTQKKNYKTSKI